MYWTHKTLFYIIVSVLLYNMLFHQGTKQHNKPLSEHASFGELLSDHDDLLTKKQKMKYILIWTLPDTIPFVSLGKGQEAFNLLNCPENKCYVTSHRKYFRDIRKFHAVLFHGPELKRLNVKPPLIRSPEQIYIFASIESSHYYLVCPPRYNNFFNWTWTYRLDSDLLFGYVVVKDKKGRVVGPNEVMHWKTDEQMSPINDEIRRKLQTKRRAAAWVVSNCNTMGKREQFVIDFDRQLARYGLFVDIFGGCGKYQCVRHMKPDCWKTIETDYYFYLSFENSFSKDYVTEKLVKPLQHYTVPIVYGAANYTRFMPEGSYLNAKKLGPVKLAEKVKDIMGNKEMYYNFFRWHNHYTYHNPQEDPATDNICRLCEALHAKDTKTKTYPAFTKWWNDSPLKC